MPTDESGHTEQATAVLLRERLRESLPTDKIAVDLLADALNGVRRDLLPLSGKPLGEVLLSSMTNLSVLQTIKHHAKKSASPVGSPQSERDTALVIYFAAIANALVIHRQKISSHSCESLDRSFVALIDKGWMTTELAELFSRARAVCQEQKS